MLHATDRGINLLFYSSDLHHFLYSRMARAVRTLCGSGSANRSKIFLAVVTYVKHPDLLEAVLFDQFAELGIDYVDLFVWGWISGADKPLVDPLLSRTSWLRGPGAPAERYLDGLFGVSDRLKSLGAVRAVGMSFHDTDLAGSLAAQSELDVVLVRHNLAHRKAQARVLKQALTMGSAKPGIICFNAARGRAGLLWQPPVPPPPGLRPPTPAECYRYSLFQPGVDACLLGPRSRTDIDSAIDAASQGALPESELADLEAYGNFYREQTLKSLPT